MPDERDARVFYRLTRADFSQISCIHGTLDEGIRDSQGTPI